MKYNVSATNECEQDTLLGEWTKPKRLTDNECEDEDERTHNHFCSLTSLPYAKNIISTWCIYTLTISRMNHMYLQYLHRMVGICGTWRTVRHKHKDTLSCTKNPSHEKTLKQTIYCTLSFSLASFVSLSLSLRLCHSLCAIYCSTRIKLSDSV